MASHPHRGRDAPDLVKRFVRFGSSPRGAQAVLLAAKIRALFDGRFAASTDDVAFMAVHSRAAAPRAAQLRGRGRGHQARPGARRDPQGRGRGPRGPTPAARAGAELIGDGPARRPPVASVTGPAAPAADDDPLRRRLPAQSSEYLAIVSAGGSFSGPPARRATHEKERQRRRVRRPPRLPAGRRLPLPRLERLPAPWPPARPPLRGRGGSRHLPRARHERVGMWPSAGGSSSGDTRRRSWRPWPTSASRTSTA